MSKAMVMIDMPNNCNRCPCSSSNVFDYDLICKLTGDIIRAPKDMPIPSNCPLVPLDMDQLDAIYSALKLQIERRKL